MWYHRYSENLRPARRTDSCSRPERYFFRNGTGLFFPELSMAKGRHAYPRRDFGELHDSSDYNAGQRIAI